MFTLLEDRQKHVIETGKAEQTLVVDKPSVAGSVSQRACVFCGSRVVLYPIADALHLVHGPVGCAAYTWDIRGSVSAGSQLYRMSFSTDLRENEVIHGGEKKLYQSLTELIGKEQPKAAFVYATCIAGLIGDDVDAVCRRVEKETGIQVIAVHSEGFKGTKKDGYRAACEALMQAVNRREPPETLNRSNNSLPTINILGEFNLAGETDIIKEYYRKMGIRVAVCFTGGCTIEEIPQARTAALNVVQCAGSMTSLAKMFQEKWRIPFLRVSYFGIEDTAKALYDVAEFFKNKEIVKRTQSLVFEEVSRILPELESYRRELQGRKAAIYVGGPFKAFSLVKALRHLGIETVVVGAQTGDPADYEELKRITNDGTIICNDSNPLELSQFILEKGADILIGGVKERPIAYKMGIGFCDHNHERKTALAGFEGMLHFAEEVHATVLSPVWRFRSSPRLPVSGGHSGGKRETDNRATGIKQTAVRNACKLCPPLGASIAMRGIENCLPLIHGSQGCATYIRRYGISHFREPLDIASSNFTETAAVFGGRNNLLKALENVTRQYKPAAVGVMSTCLSETMGEDAGQYIKIAETTQPDCPVLFYASTPGYAGTHVDGFQEAVYAVIKKLNPANDAVSAGYAGINMLSHFASAADLRELHRILQMFGTDYVLLPDYSESLDGAAWETYQKIPKGGTLLEHIAVMRFAAGTIHLGKARHENRNGAMYLQNEFQVPARFVPLPIGIENTDLLLRHLAELTGKDIPLPFELERGRLVDAYFDGHKYCYGKRAVIYGENDFVSAVQSFLNEIGIKTVFSGGEDNDFATMLEAVKEKGGADFIIGSSKGLYLSRELKIPMVRCGFPIHDRLGGHRILHLGYRGTLHLFEQICNTLIEQKQNGKTEGWTYV